MSAPEEPRHTKTPGKSDGTPLPAADGSIPAQNGRAAPSDTAPPVDEGLLLRLVRKELTQDEAREAYRLVHTFPEWNEAHTRLLVQEFRGRQQG